MTRNTFISPQRITAKIESSLFYVLLLFLPTQFGKHFWPDFSIVSGIRVDYLSPTLYFTDIIIGLLFVFWLLNNFGRVHFRKAKVFVGVIVFLSLTIFLSQNILNGMYHLIKFLEFSFVGYYVAATVKGLKKLQLITVLLALAALFESVLAILQVINQGSVGSIFYFFGNGCSREQPLVLLTLQSTDSWFFVPMARFPTPMC